MLNIAKTNWGIVPIQRGVITEKNNNGLFAHLHCHDISTFQEIYGKYLERICRYFNVVITYCQGRNRINDERFTILKIPNKGNDIGAKFCMVQYLISQEMAYKYIFFLHSQTEPKIREKYVAPLLDLFEEESSAETFIENINNYEGYFPDIQWEIKGDRRKRIKGGVQAESAPNSILPERNLLYRKELLDYLQCRNLTDRYIEGNVYLLSKKVVDRVFGDKRLYNILNQPADFDYNWVCKRYGLSGSIGKVYNEFKQKKLASQDKQLCGDGYIEQAFERIVLNIIDDGKYKLLKAAPPLFNILIRNTYHPRAFQKCIHSVLKSNI